MSLYFDPIKRRNIRKRRVHGGFHNQYYFGGCLYVRREHWPKRRVTAWCAQNNYLEDDRDNWWKRASVRHNIKGEQIMYEIIKTIAERILLDQSYRAPEIREGLLRNDIESAIAKSWDDITEHAKSLPDTKETP